MQYLPAQQYRSPIEIDHGDKGDHEIVLAAVKQDGRQLMNASKELQGDREIVLAAVKKNGLALEYASEELKANHEIVLAAVKQYGGALEYASDELKGDREIVLAAVKQDWEALEYASNELRGEREIVLAAVTQYGRALCYASTDLKANHEIVLAAVKQDGGALEYAPEELKGDHEIVLSAVNQNGRAVEYASEELQGDREIVLAAVNQYVSALEYASEELMGDREFSLAAVNQNGRALEYASEECKDDRQIVLTAVKQDGLALDYASEELMGDREIVLAAVKQSGYALEAASEELRANHEIVLAAVKQSGNTLKYASEELKANHEIVLAAVKQDGGALYGASDELKADREIVLAAVKQSGNTLKYASNELRGEREIVLAAVKQDGYALGYTSEVLRGDREIVLTAVKQYGGALEYASEELKANHEIVLAAVTQYGHALEYASDELTADREIALAAVKQNFQVFEFITLEATSCWADEVLLIVTNALHGTKEHEEEEEDSSDGESEDEAIDFSSYWDWFLHWKVLHRWVEVEEMAEKLKLLVKNDPTIADIENCAGKTAIDLAIPVCQKKIKEGLRLFGKYEVGSGAWEHLSPTACVIKVNYFGEGEGNQEPVPMVLKCMSNFEEVKAELECRKKLDFADNCADHVMLIEHVHVDSSLEHEYNDLKQIELNETATYLERGLKNAIRNIVKKKAIKRMDIGGDRNKDYSFKYVLAFPFADRTLNRAMKDDRIKGTLLGKYILKHVANGLLELHESGGCIHSDIKPPNILRDGTTWKLADLDISCPIKGKYGKKTPSTGWCPPEVVDKISKGQLQSYDASIAHDLWSFGAIMYKLETGTELFQVDDRDDIVNVKEIRGWSNAAMRRKKLQQVKGQEAKDLLKKLLEFDPEKRFEYFNKDGESVMENVLEDGYFSQHTNMLDRLGSIRKGVGRIDEKLDTMCLDIAEIKDLTMAQQIELKQTSKVLLHAIYEATEVQTPTTFVILDEPLPDEPEELSACDMIDSYETLSEDVQAQLDEWKGRLDQAKAWIERLANSEISNLMQDVKPEDVIEYINKAANKLVVKDTMYFYWIDELAAKPVRADGFPIEITKPADIVPKLLPYVQVGMCAMSLYCGSAGIARMFGFPVPTVPKKFRDGLRVSVETLKQSSSVEVFQCVHEKVEANDEEAGTHRGAALRELEDFVENIIPEELSDKFAGLRRIADEDGSAVWTLKTKEEVPDELRKRSARRKREAALAAKELEELEERKEELKQMGNKCDELEKKVKSEAEKAKQDAELAAKKLDIEQKALSDKNAEISEKEEEAKAAAERAAKDLEDLRKTNAEISKKEKEAKADAEDLQKALDKKCCVIC